MSRPAGWGTVDDPRRAFGPYANGDSGRTRPALSGDGPVVLGEMEAVCDACQRRYRLGPAPTLELCALYAAGLGWVCDSCAPATLSAIALRSLEAVREAMCGCGSPHAAVVFHAAGCPYVTAFRRITE